MTTPETPIERIRRVLIEVPYSDFVTINGLVMSTRLSREIVQNVVKKLCDQGIVKTSFAEVEDDTIVRLSNDVEVMLWPKRNTMLRFTGRLILTGFGEQVLNYTNIVAESPELAAIQIKHKNDELRTREPLTGDACQVWTDAIAPISFIYDHTQKDGLRRVSDAELNFWRTQVTNAYRHENIDLAIRTQLQEGLPNENQR